MQNLCEVQTKVYFTLQVLRTDTTFDASHNLRALSEVNINAALKYHTSI